MLEAMERGLPIACSTAPSLPEVAGEAARYFDPLDENDIAAAIVELIEDARLRKELTAAGRERVRRFSWGARARPPKATSAPGPMRQAASPAPLPPRRLGSKAKGRSP